MDQRAQKNNRISKVSSFDVSQCSILIKPLIEQEKDGIYLFLHGKLIWFKIKISLIIGDWPEACTFCLTYKTSNSTMSYLFNIKGSA